MSTVTFDQAMQEIKSALGRGLIGYIYDAETDSSEEFDASLLWKADRAIVSGQTIMMEDRNGNVVFRFINNGKSAVTMK